MTSPSSLWKVFLTSNNSKFNDFIQPLDLNGDNPDDNLSHLGIEDDNPKPLEFTTVRILPK